ncbi:MAG: glycosyltransferase family 4 protein, partial [Candidatus Omnitrophica bacterium]|nr:glycosyltransferase family 4 protein [Candidatus Omnitrophota bacterium]
LAKLNYSIPLVVTTHSLEPLRPWKREQLAGGYNCSLWIEKTAIEMANAVIAVSAEAKKDILKFFKIRPSKIHVIHNGIDLNEYRPVKAPQLLKRFGIDPQKPYLLFVGRITRQKGIIHLVNAIKYLDGGFQVVLCAGAPDTEEIGKEMKDRVAAMQKKRNGIIWIHQMLDLPSKVALYSHADVFCCPSIYEPFGIINLEAMACETAVVASAVGGIKEVVVEGKTGFLVNTGKLKDGSFELEDPVKFEKELARKINELMKNKRLRDKMGKAGRKRALEHFSWPAVAKQTCELYRSVLSTTS